MLTLVAPAVASHPEASLPGSNFEIDVNANLKQDDPSPSIDWASVTESRKIDLATGQNDDSYAGGTKEDDACPGTTTGSIPNNKSDLLTFGAYVEPGATANDPGFLNLFWTRVQEPSGTTLMDFELNQSSTGCGNGVNPVRTAGDLLIEYRIEQGGAIATLKVREWTGSAWGPAQDLTAVGAATGTINSTAIPVAESDGLTTTNPLSARTFGEAQLDLSFILDPNKCESFGSAFLKSRSSDSFTSQLKDLIKPTPVQINNCGRVVIRKQTDPDGATATFDYDHNLQTDPALVDNPATPGINEATEFQLQDNGVRTFDKVLFGSGYSVSEDDLPAGWDFTGIDCAASKNVTPVIDTFTRTVSFDIDSAQDLLDCTFNNKARGSIVIEKITDDGNGSFDFTSGTLAPSPFTLTTTAAGAAGKASRTFSDLVPGTYDVAETVPSGWNLVSSSCSDGSAPAAIGLAAGETVTCTFHDARERGAILVTKTRKHAAAGPGDHPQQGVTFTVTGGELPAAGVTRVTDANGQACFDDLVLSSFVGNYTVTETVPAGYHAAGATAKAAAVTAEATCASGTKTPVSFQNIPLTDFTVSVNSQIDGGTASTITCDTSSASTGPNGDGSLTVSNKEPGIYTCTINIDP
jgi:prealbumin domain-containing protein